MILGLLNIFMYNMYLHFKYIYLYLKIYKNRTKHSTQDVHHVILKKKMQNRNMYWDLTEITGLF